MKTTITIKYTSGETEAYVVKPPDFRIWEMKYNKKLEEGTGINDIMFLAYTAMTREANNKGVKPYEVWCLTVDDIEPGDDDPKATQSEA